MQLLLLEEEVELLLLFLEEVELLLLEEVVELLLLFLEEVELLWFLHFQDMCNRLAKHIGFWRDHIQDHLDKV